MKAARPIRLLLIYVVLLIHCATVISEAGPKEHELTKQTDLVVIIMIDGARQSLVYETVDTLKKPAIRQLIKNGTAFAGQAVYPTITMVNFVSLATGSFPETHGISSMYGRLSDTEVLTFYEPPHVAAPTIFEVLENHNWRGVFFSHKGYDANGVGDAERAIVIQGPRIAARDTIISKVKGDKYGRSIDNFTEDQSYLQGWAEDLDVASTPEEAAFATKIRTTQVMVREGLAQLSRASRDDIALIVANFAAPDIVAHAWGPNHRYYDASIQEMDRGITYFKNAIEKLFKGRRITYVVSADHGFTDSDDDRIILGWNRETKTFPLVNNLLAGIPHQIRSCGGTCFSIFVQGRNNQRKVFSRLKNVRDNHPSSWIDKIYTYLDNYHGMDGRLQDLRTYYPNRTAEFYIDLKPQFTTSQLFGHGSMHAENVDIPIVLSGAGIKKQGILSENASITDVAPTALYLLGIEPPDEWDGSVLSTALAK